MPDTRQAWRAFEHGDHITDDELDALIAQTEAALPYLNARLPEYRLAQKDTLQTLATLKDYRQARRSPTR